MESDKNIYSSKDYKISRKAYIAQCTFEYFVSILVTDAFLAKLLSSMGISDAYVGIFSSFITFAFLFQLAALLLVRKIKNVKKSAIMFSTASPLLFMLLYLVPFMPVGVHTKTLLVAVFLLGAYFFNYIITSVIFKWCNSYVDPEKRASYSAGKEMVSLVSGMLFTLIVGMVMDRYEALGNLEGSFLFISIAVLILSICNFISLMLVKNTDVRQTDDAPPLKTVFKKVLLNKNYRSIIMLTILWNVAVYTTVGFLGIYKTKDLLYSVGTVQIINIAANIFRCVVSKPFGKFSDKYSYARGIELAMCIAAAAFLINSFTAPSTRILIVVYTILYNVSIAGTNQNLINITYSYVESEYFVQATAIKNSIGGICGFLASLLAGKLVSYIQKSGNMIFGLHVYAQQILSLCSFILIAAAILYIHFLISKQKIMKQ